jgi:UDP-N-acetylmuramoyl-L-alanyl-D-glutamate--2,6-diaminopimelate ligase
MSAALAVRGRHLGEVLGAEAGAFARVAVTDFTLDSREVVPGAAFVALAGGKEHGLRYAADALARGAAVVLYEPSAVYADPPSPSLAVPNLKARLGEIAHAFFATRPEPALVGVTGTNGKTTVAYLAAQALGAPQRPCGYIGTLGYGVPPKLTRHALTTPDTLTLHREIAAMRSPRVVLEVSSHALAQNRIAGLKIRIAVFTNLTRDHLDEHGDLATYGRAKARLFQLPELEHAVLNVDDAFGASLAANLAHGCEVIRTTLRAARGADLSARLRRADLDGLDLEISGRFGTAQLTSKLIGDFNAENLLCALGALLADGMPIREACAALASAVAAPGRMEVLGGSPDRPWVVIDYAHTPDALLRALKTLEALGPRKITCVFGCGGDRDRGKRPLMGGVAAGTADRIVLTDDNPRNEDPAKIVRDIRAGVGDHADVVTIHDRRAAIRAALEGARPGDVVLVAGKGHETEQVQGSERRPFDDRAVALELLGSRS